MKLPYLVVMPIYSESVILEITDPWLKGIASQDFLSRFFLHQAAPPGPMAIWDLKAQFRTSKIFAELFQFDSPCVCNTGESWSAALLTPQSRKSHFVTLKRKLQCFWHQWVETHPCFWPNESRLIRAFDPMSWDLPVLLTPWSQDSLVLLTLRSSFTVSFGIKPFIQP